MPVQPYSLGKTAAKQLADVVRRVRRQPRNAPARRRRSVSVGKGTQFRRITFTTASALLASDASQDDCPVALVWYGPDPGTTVTVYNELGFQADAGVDGYADYSPPDDKWKIIIIPCPAGSS